MADPMQPKFDIKMLAMPVIFYLSRKVDFTNETVVNTCRGVFVSAVIIVLSLYYIAYSTINARKGN